MASDNPVNDVRVSIDLLSNKHLDLIPFTNRDDNHLIKSSR